MRKMRGGDKPYKAQQGAWRLICNDWVLYWGSHASGLVGRLESIFGTLMKNRPERMRIKREENEFGSVQT